MTVTSERLATMSEVQRSSWVSAARWLLWPLVVAAPLGLSAIDSGMPSDRWLLVAGAPIALYGVYAVTTAMFFPASTPPMRRALASVDRGTREVDWLLLLRGIAAAIVFIMHSEIVLDWTPPWQNGPLGWITYCPAWLGMMIFFTLSGYLMGKGFYTGKYDANRSGVTRYLRNRALRIFPLMFVVGLFVILWQSPQVLAAPKTVTRLMPFGFNGVGGTDSFGAFWSLSTEWQFYLLVPAFFVAMAAVDRWGWLPIITVLAVGLGPAIRSYQWSHHPGWSMWSLYIFTPLYDNLDVFLIGFLANWWRPKLSALGPALSRSWAAVLIGTVLGYSYVAFWGFGRQASEWSPVFVIWLPGITALSLVLVIVGMEGTNDRMRNRPPRQRLAVTLYWIGALTFPVYLVHSSILDALQIGLPYEAVGVRIGLSIALTIVIALILNVTVERTVMGWRRSADTALRSVRQDAVS